MIEPMPSTLELLRRIQEHMQALSEAPEFGPWLRGARQALGLRLADVADGAGLSLQYISDVERGRRCPMGTEYAREIAGVLGVDEAELVARMVVGRMAWRAREGMARAALEAGKGRK